MAHSAGTVWEVRTTGHASNGAGFDSSYGGTDYSQQDAAQLTLTDCTFSAASTTLTSVTGGFTAAMVGNYVWMGAVATHHGWRQVVAWVSSTQVTLDSNAPGTEAGAGHIRLGGAYLMATQGLLFAPVAGNKVWIKAGTYSQSSNTITLTTGSALQPLVVEGYNTTRGDCTADPTLARPVWDWTASAVVGLTLNGTCEIVRSMEFNHAGSSQTAVLFNVASQNCILENCKVTTDTDTVAVDVQGSRHRITRNYIICGSGNSDGLLLRGGGGHTADYNHIRSSAAGANAYTGILVDVGGNFIRNNVIQKMGIGILDLNATMGAATIQQNIIHRCTNGIEGRHAAEGIGWLTSVHANIISRCTRGLYYQVADISLNTGAIQWAQTAFDCNFFYGNTNNYVQLPAGHGDTTLTADPFTDEAAYDFSLNAAAGGGQTVRDTLCEVEFADGLNTASIVGGIVGSPAAAAPTDLAAARSLWRELTNERNTDVIEDEVVDLYLDGGVIALNRRIHYYWKISSSAITLVAGTQEYDQPTDMVKLHWIEWNGKQLKKGDVEEWRSRNIDYRNVPDGQPAEWAHYGDKIIFMPAPDGAAVAVSATPTLRYCATPPSVTDEGFDQLSSQDHRIAVYHGVAEFSASYPDSAVAAGRVTHYHQKFVDEAQGVAQDYKDRGMGR